MKDKYIYLTFLFFLIYSANVYPTLPWDMQKGERIVLPNCSVNKKDTINDVFIVYLKDSIQLYKVISTQEKFMSALEEDSTYDVVLEVIKGYGTRDIIIDHYEDKRPFGVAFYGKITVAGESPELWLDEEAVRRILNR